MLTENGKYTTEIEFGLGSEALGTRGPRVGVEMALPGLANRKMFGALRERGVKVILP